ncbi:hypothetical protein AXF42_Ash001624 [Apostasia shenzhenica]|uniref:Uncharacterized protein n=1 Tax=Apostasia shenzhenica TaxID=1088818 RepID=A0A2I0AAR6_9ASPA|nr:hypothetical protein AXF42_Ash001624 [Apostasia shenzhenica]
MDIDLSDQTGHSDVCNVLGDVGKESEGTRRWSRMDREKRAAVRAELEKVNRLPPNSSYAVHRLRVLNKIVNLMSIQTLSQWECLHAAVLLIKLGFFSHHAC